VLDYPAVLIYLGHLAGEVRVEPWMATKRADDFGVLSIVERPPGDLGDDLVAECVPGAGR
jgi:hypothetical protein